MAKGRRSYDYTPDFDSTVDRAENKGSMFDNMFKDVKLFSAQQGANLIRILPPTWQKPKHYGLMLSAHSNIGPKDRQYLCLRENEHSPYKRCPVCEALYELGARATQQDKMDLRATNSVAYFIIDRNNEKEGVQVWKTSAKNDSELAAQSFERKSGTVLNLSHPDEGFDIEFIRTGTTRNNTRYRGFRIMRESSLLSDNDKRYNEWLDFIEETPLPSTLQFYKPEHIEEVFYGRAKEDEDEDEKPRGRVRDVRDEDEEDVESRKLERRRTDDDEEEDQKKEPRRRNRSAEEEDETDERESGRSRSKLSKDLDDEIPFKGRRGNGRDEEKSSERQTRRRSRLDEDDEQEPSRGSRARSTANEEEDETNPRRKIERNDDNEDDANERTRQRMKRRLDRGEEKERD